MTENKEQIRNYKHEHKLRMRKNKRFVVEVHREKAELFEAYLKGQGLTYSQWIKNKIDIELRK